MREALAQLEQLGRSVLPAGLDTVELYLKTGRSRRAALGAQGRLSSLHRERGWAVRASGSQSSLFCCGSGAFEPAGPWPTPDGAPLRLPAPHPVSGWSAPADLEAPLCVEHEALEILEVCVRQLGRELPEARLLQATLEDGESASTVVNSRGVEASWRQRNATLYLEAALGDDEIFEYVGERTARVFDPTALARRMADRLLIRRDGSIGDSVRGPVLLAPPVAVRLLGALLPALLGRQSSGKVKPGRREIASQHLTIVDDGRLEGGLFAAPVDGEGTPTGRAVLIENGVTRALLHPGATTASEAGKRVGTVRRASYRDVPRVGPSHLFIEPNPKQAPAGLLDGISNGHYFLEAMDAGRFDLDADRYEMTVGGFAVRRGKPVAKVSGARISGRVSELLEGLEAVARDLTFFSFGSLLGSPSLLIDGIAVNDPKS